VTEECIASGRILVSDPCGRLLYIKEPMRHTKILAFSFVKTREAPTQLGEQFFNKFFFDRVFVWKVFFSLVF